MIAKGCQIFPYPYGAMLPTSNTWQGCQHPNSGNVASHGYGREWQPWTQANKLGKT